MYLSKINKIIVSLLVGVFICLLGFGFSQQLKTKHEFKYKANEFKNVLNLKNTPRQAIDWQSFCFSDKGAWFGFALPDSVSENRYTFTGPFLMTQGKWISKSLLNLEILDENSILLSPLKSESVFYPGKLVRKLKYSDFDLDISLIFISEYDALICAKFDNIKSNCSVIPVLKGNVFSSEAKVCSRNTSIHIKGTEINSELNIYFREKARIKQLIVNDSSYLARMFPINLATHNCISTVVSYNDFQCHKHNNADLINDALTNPHTYLLQNTYRWNSYIDNALKSNAGWANRKEYQHIAVKSVITLINNWRCAYGDLLHDGLFPSYAVNYFNGFWAWDSWKHAVALACFEPDLAKNQIRAMYDYQNADGMIADCIYANKTENNWLNTKPPLSGWAIWNVYTSTNDIDFLYEMYPKLIKYHQWWYKFRDANKNNLCEYGSTDGSLIAAKWESGMDNAIRFDEATMVKIDKQNYAFNQESVDLNSYLYKEKLMIAKIANELSNADVSKTYKTEAAKLQKLINEKMYDKHTGYYYDIDIKTQKTIATQGPEGWIPLFALLASPNKAQEVIQNMFDTTKFSTYIPFPTAPKDNPEFSTKYWRGPIWLDQVYFAIQALTNYDCYTEANEYTLQIFDRLEGLKQQAPIRENYWPIDGKGMRVNHFSWSAAHLLLLYKHEK